MSLHTSSMRLPMLTNGSNTQNAQRCAQVQRQEEMESTENVRYNYAK